MRSWYLAYRIRYSSNNGLGHFVTLVGLSEMQKLLSRVSFLEEAMWQTPYKLLSTAIHSEDVPALAGTLRILRAEKFL